MYFTVIMLINSPFVLIKIFVFENYTWLIRLAPPRNFAVRRTPPQSANKLATKRELKGECVLNCHLSGIERASASQHEQLGFALVNTTIHRVCLSGDGRKISGTLCAVSERKHPLLVRSAKTTGDSIYERCT